MSFGPSLRGVARFLGVAPRSSHPTEALWSGLGGCVAIAAVVLLSRHFVGDGAHLLVASMGASAVLLFALPHGPLSQPWAVLVGHGSSAAIGVLCGALVDEPPLAGALAVGASIGFMQLLRCIHPPGGATALSAVVGGPEIHALGASYVFTPVLLNAGIIVAVACLFHAAPRGRRYPAALRPAREVFEDVPH